MSFTEAKLIIFDLDSTLAESKAALSDSMVETIQNLLKVKKVAVISGGNFPQFKKQFLANFKNDDNFENLLLMPATGTHLYVYMDSTWSLVYAKDLTDDEKQKIKDAFSEMFKILDYQMPEEMYGEMIEDRDSQITFSGLGQDAPLALKSVWDPDHKKREAMVAVLKKIIPEFNIQIGGATSIDVTTAGVNKASGVEMLQRHLKLSDADVLFVGDALYKGGNDYPVISTDVECIEVQNPADTERLIKSWL